MFDYFYGQSGEMFSYFRVPQILFRDIRFKDLSTDAKTLYGILLDRMSLSVKNGWLDGQGRVYIIFPVQEVMDALGCADNKATKLFRELENAGLVERKRRGLGKPNLIYVKNFADPRYRNRDRDTSAAELIDDAAVLFQRRCRASSDAGASSGNNDDLVVFSHHDFPPENVDLVRVYRSAGRLSIPIAGLWKSTGINLRKFLHSQCQSTLEIETLRKYTILVMLYKFERALVYQLAVKDLPELKCAAGSKPYEDENEIR